MLPPVSYPPCTWSTDGERCRFPGTMTSSAVGGPDTQWFCSLHFGLIDLERGAQFVRASRDYVHRPAGKTPEDLQLEAIDYCQAQGLLSVDDMRKFIRAKLRSARVPNTDWAKKILDRADAGQDVSHHALQMALGVLPNRVGDERASAPAGDSAGVAPPAPAEEAATIECANFEGTGFDGSF